MPPPREPYQSQQQYQEYQQQKRYDSNSHHRPKRRDSQSHTPWYLQDESNPDGVIAKPFVGSFDPVTDESTSSLQSQFSSISGDTNARYDTRPKENDSLSRSDRPEYPNEVDSQSSLLSSSSSSLSSVSASASVSSQQLQYPQHSRHPQQNQLFHTIHEKYPTFQGSFCYPGETCTEATHVSSIPHQLPHPNEVLQNVPTNNIYFYMILTIASILASFLGYTVQRRLQSYKTRTILATVTAATEITTTTVKEKTNQENSSSHWNDESCHETKHLSPSSSSSSTLLRQSGQKRKTPSPSQEFHRKEEEEEQRAKDNMIPSSPTAPFLTTPSKIKESNKLQYLLDSDEENEILNHEKEENEIIPRYSIHHHHYDPYDPNDADHDNDDDDSDAAYAEEPELWEETSPESPNSVLNSPCLSIMTSPMTPIRKKPSQRNDTYSQTSMITTPKRRKTSHEGDRHELIHHRNCFTTPKAFQAQVQSLAKVVSSTGLDRRSALKLANASVLRRLESDFSRVQHEQQRSQEQKLEQLNQRIQKALEKCQTAVWNVMNASFIVKCFILSLLSQLLIQNSIFISVLSSYIHGEIPTDKTLFVLMAEQICGCSTNTTPLGASAHTSVVSPPSSSYSSLSDSTLSSNEWDSTSIYSTWMETAMAYIPSSLSSSSNDYNSSYQYYLYPSQMLKQLSLTTCWASCLLTWMGGLILFFVCHILLEKICFPRVVHQMLNLGVLLYIMSSSNQDEHGSIGIASDMVSLFMRVVLVHALLCLQGVGVLHYIRMRIRQQQQHQQQQQQQEQHYVVNVTRLEQWCAWGTKMLSIIPSILAIGMGAGVSSFVQVSRDVLQMGVSWMVSSTFRMGNIN